MELRHLRYFSVLAEELHFGRAARRLSISQPPLSVAIRQLEDSVGARLFERNSKEVRLTHAGEALRISARRLLQQAQEAATEARDVASGSAGRLRIGFVGAMLYRGLPPALRAFQAKHSAVRITLNELNSGVQIAELLHDRLDLGFVHTSRMPPELHHRLLLTEPFVCCLPAGHSLARKKVLAPADLRDQPFVLFSREASPDYHERILSICSDAGFLPEVRHEVRHWLAVVSLVSQGMGVALVPQAMRNSALRGAVFRPLDRPVVQSESYGVWRAGPPNVLIERLLQGVANAQPATAGPPQGGRASPMGGRITRSEAK